MQSGNVHVQIPDNPVACGDITGPQASKSNINPKVWGPNFWKTFHYTAFGFPEDPSVYDIVHYFDFYNSFIKILPCDECSYSSIEILQKVPLPIIDLGSAIRSGGTVSYYSDSNQMRQILIKWTYDFHDEVNKKLNKTSPTYEQFIYKYTNTPTSNFKKSILLCLLLILCIILTMRYT